MVDISDTLSAVRVCDELRKEIGTSDVGRPDREAELEATSALPRAHVIKKGRHDEIADESRR